MNKENIKKIIKSNFTKDHFEVIDVNNDNSHFSILIISDKFDGLSLINRHKIIYNLLNQYISKEIHALQIKTYTVDEWNNN